ncbi:uncharacterized protein ACLA_025970 [Aspergillus clavatus NRRL 1]|uniref:AHC1-like C2H2 zinc-finger domain-containing protein n=1 Tax=Aspergillus clavatus (strain ATCC 1007 / CBS 513.65 / DSM 816 / NCTC 3887 / NRRL 1 / QM 1276 / 107) TaxID=344612 RepID=A1CQF9_ASPCL|nr:uncharacterized protein ACLA_025970 [Aspergillus clavatus NRRL 1]EAW07880.1 conserved hypothetical protein [Aspergillus clavatus NRRL 1]
MFRLLPWSSALGGNKVMAEELKMLAISPHCASPGLNSLALPQLKRKRSGSTDAAADEDAPVATKLRCDDASRKSSRASAQSGGAASPEESPSNSFPSQSSRSPHRRKGSSASSAAVADQPTAPRKVDTDALRETLEAQLSLEVLLKHNELRLIDQEIAKCQIALEQLRRCAEIPYPGSHVAAGASQSVSNGTGMAVHVPENGPAPLSPAPWGVTDGPYTRHYARWLIPDPRFDGGEFASTTPLTPGAVGTPAAEGRSTRGNPSEGYLANKSRFQRGSMGARLQSLPTGYPTPKEKAGPMIMRRKSDGVMVKLICLDCRRDNFSSTQGFINHCRIAHNRSFASHDAAAMASGEPVEVDEAGAVVPQKNETPTAATAGFVHPLIRSAHVIDPSPPKAAPSPSPAAGDAATPRRRSVPSRRASSAVETPTLRSSPGKRASPAGSKTAPVNSFLGSPDTPHLSSLVKRRGVGLDLDQLVGEAKTTVDLEGYSSGAESEDELTQTAAVFKSRAQKPLGNRVARQPMRTTGPQAASQRPGSRKGMMNQTSLGSPRDASSRSPYASASSGAKSTPMEEDLREELSPTTLESNQAPSLVSDDDEYGAASESESPGPSSSEADEPDEEFSHIDVEDDEEEAAASTAATDPKSSDPDMASGAAHPSTRLSRSLRRGNTKKKDRLVAPSMAPVRSGKGGKRVSFVSPHNTPVKGKRNAPKKSSGRKL